MYWRVIWVLGSGMVMNTPTSQPVPSNTITPTAAFICLWNSTQIKWESNIIKSKWMNLGGITCSSLKSYSFIDFDTITYRVLPSLLWWKLSLIEQLSKTKLLLPTKSSSLSVAVALLELLITLSTKTKKTTLTRSASIRGRKKKTQKGIPPGFRKHLKHVVNLVSC